MGVRDKSVFTFFLREYHKTGQKNEWGLRCKDPLLVNEYQLDVFPVLDVSKDDFKALTKVKVQVVLHDGVFRSSDINTFLFIT